MQEHKTEDYCFYQNTVCDSKKLKFIKEQEASGWFSSWGINAPLSKIPLVAPLLFERYYQVLQDIKWME